MTDFGDRAIRYIRHVLDVTGHNAGSLAKAAKIAPSTLNRPLRNPKSVGSLSNTTIGKIAAATGVDPAPFISTRGYSAGSKGSVGDRIVQRLSAVGKNASAVSLEAGLNRAAVRDIIANDANPRIDTLRKLAGPLCCDLSFLTGETGSGANGEQAADLLAFLHYVRAEHGIDVPERHFEMLRALKSSAPSTPEASK
jgi:DNA-binding phage protein